jgi:radical SAM superfamily enzyme YgiQ (UPF0313 family)
MTDIIFLSVPKLQVQGPILSIHLLKACAIEAGFSARSADFNAWFANETKGTLLHEAWTNSDNNLLTDFDAIKSIEDQYIMYWNKFYEEKIKKYNPKIIALTVFSYWTWPNIRIIAEQIREENPNIKILIGGPGVKFKGKVEPILPYIDDYISGDAEYSIVEYLKGNRDYSGINSLEHNNNFSRKNTPIPNYDDIDKSLYINNPLGPVYSLVGSRGCVRKCSFCNVPAIWNKFIFKSGKQNAKEMIYLYEKYGAKTFTFTDSLINGNYKEFMIMLEELANFKNKNKDCEINFTGQFITREKNQVKEEMFDLMFASGYYRATTGIETGSQRLRFEMKKRFSNDAIEYHLEQFEKSGLEMAPLMFVGFPTETDEDFQETINILDMFARYPKVVKDIWSDNPMMITYNSDVHNNLDNYHVEEYIDANNWTSKYSDRKKRIERHYIFLHEAQKRNLWKPAQLTSKRTYTMAEEYMKFDNPKKEVVDIIDLWYE